MGIFLAGAGISIVVLAVVLMAIDIDITQTRRIEQQVARDSARIRGKTLRGWSVARIQERYPDISLEHIRGVRRTMERTIAADQEIRLLHHLWSMNPVEADYET